MRTVDFHRALETLGRGDPLVYPTETFYGLGVDIRRAEALEKLFALKGRDSGQPVSVLVSSLESFQSLVSELDSKILKIINKFLPGPLTLVLPAAPGLAPQLLSGKAEVGLRWSSHPLAQRLVEAFGAPITTTSANPSGSPAASSEAELQAYFDKNPELAYLGGGVLPASRGSTVLRIQNRGLELLREGDIPFADLQREYFE